MSNLSSLPIVLRKEAFGGIVFDPADATFIELDHDGFKVVGDYAINNGQPFNAQEANLLREVGETLTRLDGRRFRRISNDIAIEKDPVPVLSAPSLVDFQITDQCHLDCPHCYASSTSAGGHAKIEDIFLALEQVAEVGAFQVAIGGGEPLLYPHLEQVLSRCHELGLVPNLTTSGQQLNDRNLEMLKHYCGAVGLSLEGVGNAFSRYRKSGFGHFQKSLSRLKHYKIPTVLQITLNTETLAQLDSLTEFCCNQEELYGIIFLAYKPVGRGTTFAKPLATLPHSQVNDKLQQAFFTLSEVTRVGFDCCLTPGVTGSGNDFDTHAAQYLEGCSALRSSIGLLPNLDVLPCTFTAEHAVGNLHEHHLRDIWTGLHTGRFREHMANRAANNASCSNCRKYSYCLGGCPVMELVNCSNDYLANLS